MFVWGERRREEEEKRKERRESKDVRRGEVMICESHPVSSLALGSLSLINSTPLSLQIGLPFTCLSITYFLTGVRIYRVDEIMKTDTVCLYCKSYVT
jgi:hypothetical protein